MVTFFISFSDIKLSFVDSLITYHQKIDNCSVLDAYTNKITLISVRFGISLPGSDTFLKCISPKSCNPGRSSDTFSDQPLHCGIAWVSYFLNFFLSSSIWSLLGSLHIRHTRGICSAGIAGSSVRLWECYWNLSRDSISSSGAAVQRRDPLQLADWRSASPSILQWGGWDEITTWANEREMGKWDINS